MKIIIRKIVFLVFGLAISIFIATEAKTIQAQEVNGIYTEPATKDLGEITGKKSLKGIKIRGWAETYIQHNFNNPNADVVNQNQLFSVVKSKDLRIEGRTFDVRGNSFRPSIFEVEIEKVPERNRFGFKLDLAYGDVQNIIYDTVRAASPRGIRGAERVIQHASVSYVAPVGKGLRIDAGKFVTHIGGETIESIKNRNFSRSYFYTYAIPFQDTGVRLNYAFNPKVYVEFYALQGWNVTFDNNKGKTFGASVGYTPTSKLAIYANYLGGPERNNNSRDRRDLVDVQVVYSLTKTLQTIVNVDIGNDQNAVAQGLDAKWGGITFYIRKNYKGRFFPTLRAEYYNDPHGFTTGAAQKIGSFTFTGDYKIGKKDGFVKYMLRPEARYDFSNAPFFSRGDQFRVRKQQFTAGIGLVAYF